MNVVKAQNISNITDNLVNETFNDTDHILEDLENFTSNDTVSDEILDNKSNDWGDDNNTKINETVEIVFNKSISLNQTNETSLENNETSSENITGIISGVNNTVPYVWEGETSTTVPDLIEGPVFDINIKYPQKITRGETITIAGVATANSNVKNVVLEWVIPEDFIVSGSKTKDCGDLAPTSSCTSEIGVMADLSSNLGIREIKIVVKYEE
jgi:hypothetical protein